MRQQLRTNYFRSNSANKLSECTGLMRTKKKKTTNVSSTRVTHFFYIPLWIVSDTVYF